MLIDRAHFLAKLKRDGGSTTASTAPAPSLATAVVAPPALGTLDILSNLTAQQFRPAEFAVSPSELAHVAPITPNTDGFVNVGGSGEIRGQVVWMTNADIDLHMVAPNSSHVYFGNSTVTLGSATARLDHDNLGSVIDAAPDKRIENIMVTGSQIPVGLYSFSAHSFSGNNNGLPTTVQIRVTGDANATALTNTATLSSGQTSSNYIVNYQGVGVAPVYTTQP